MPDKTVYIIVIADPYGEVTGAGSIVATFVGETLEAARRAVVQSIFLDRPDEEQDFWGEETRTAAFQISAAFAANKIDEAFREFIEWSGYEFWQSTVTVAQ